MGLTLKTAPANEPVSGTDARSHCRIDASDDDELLSGLITSARMQAEHITGRALITQKWELTLDEFPDWEIKLPYGPLQTVQTVTYLDTDGVRQTLASTEYQVVISELVGKVQPAYSKSWPSCRSQPDSIAVNYTCGHGVVKDVPQAIKQWILMAVATMYDQRGALVTGTINEIPRGFMQGLLDPYIVPRM